MIGVLCLLLVAQSSGAPSAAPELPRIERALRRGTTWLCEQQSDDGSFRPSAGRELCRLALSAMALWSLDSTAGRALDPRIAEEAARYLLAHQRDNGGIYDPARGLAVYTSGISARALRSLGPRPQWPELAQALGRVELFTYRRAAPESEVDAAQVGATPSTLAGDVARATLRDAPPAEAAARRALEFLARCDTETLRHPARIRNAFPQRRDDAAAPFSYDDLLPFVYFELAPEHQIAQRALTALQRYYTPERNPDLTKRYGADGFGAGTQGLFYYYFVSARALSSFGLARLVTADGVEHDWARELSAKLIGMQRPDGSWANQDAQWWEAEPVLATSYALLTLELCRASLERAR